MGEPEKSGAEQALRDLCYSDPLSCREILQEILFGMFLRVCIAT